MVKTFHNARYSDEIRAEYEDPVVLGGLEWRMVGMLLKLQ